MINITNKIDCCGCNACGDVCAHGAITFKTDNEGLFEFTLEQIEEVGLEIMEMSRDLHNEQLNPELTEGNITTEYEDKFAGIGKNINYVKFRAK